MPRRVLVTGGCGFIGSHLVELLLTTTDWHVTVLDGLTYAGDASRLAQLSGYDPTRARVLWHDLRAPIPDTLSAKLGQFDAIYHFAASTHVDRSITDPLEFWIGNNAVSAHFYDWVRREQGRTLGIVIHVSTDEVYGPAPDGYASHEWDTILPSNPYSGSKAGCEAIAFSAWRTYDVPLVLVNIMNVIGRRQAPEKFLPRTIRSIQAGLPVTVHARPIKLSGEVKVGGAPVQDATVWEPSSRVWIHADDVAGAILYIDANLRVVRYPLADRPERWHIAGTDEVDVATMARWIGAELGVEPELEWVDYHSSRPGHDHRYALDSSKLTAAGWSPKMTTREAVAAVVKWEVEHA